MLRMSGSESSAQPLPPPQGAGSIAEEKVKRMQELEHGEERCGTLSPGHGVTVACMNHSDQLLSPTTQDLLKG